MLDLTEDERQAAVASENIRFVRIDGVVRQGIGYATMSPNCSIGRLQGASFPSETCVRASL